MTVIISLMVFGLSPILFLPFLVSSLIMSVFVDYWCFVVCMSLRVSRYFSGCLFVLLSYVTYLFSLIWTWPCKILKRNFEFVLLWFFVLMCSRWQKQQFHKCFASASDNPHSSATFGHKKEWLKSFVIRHSFCALIKGIAQRRPQSCLAIIDHVYGKCSDWCKGCIWTGRQVDWCSFCQLHSKWFRISECQCRTGDCEWNCEFSFFIWWK